MLPPHRGNQTFPYLETLRCASSSFFGHLFWHSTSDLSHNSTVLQIEKNNPHTELKLWQSQEFLLRDRCNHCTANIWFMAGFLLHTVPPPRKGHKLVDHLPVPWSRARTRGKRILDNEGLPCTSLPLDFCSASSAVPCAAGFLPPSGCSKTANTQDWPEGP